MPAEIHPWTNKSVESEGEWKENERNLSRDEEGEGKKQAAREEEGNAHP